MTDRLEEQSIRRALYVLFARLLAGPPDAPLYRRLHEGGLAGLAAAQGVDLTSDLLDEEDADSSAAELAAEYDRMTHHLSLRASDYESRSEDPVKAMAGYLKEHALRLDSSLGLPFDHLSVALAVMGELAQQSAVAERAGAGPEAQVARDRARAFLHRHVLSWAQNALAEISSRSDRNFYRGLAAMIAAFLESERRLYAAA